MHVNSKQIWAEGLTYITIAVLRHLSATVEQKRVSHDQAYFAAHPAPAGDYCFMPKASFAANMTQAAVETVHLV